MRAKGWRKDKNPEKMPVVTRGLAMVPKPPDYGAPERLTGGNAPADESMTSKLVVDYIRGVKPAD